MIELTHKEVGAIRTALLLRHADVKINGGDTSEARTSLALMKSAFNKLEEGMMKEAN